MKQINLFWTTIAILTAGTLLLGSIYGITKAIQGFTAISDDTETEALTPVNAAVEAQTIAAATEVTTQALTAHKMPEAPYLLKLSEDTLSVYALGSSVPFETYHVSAGWFPDYDRIVLEYGLQIDTAADLRRILEDYIS